MEEITNSSSRWRKWALRGVLILLLITAVLVLRRMALLPYADFIQYWSAGRLNLAGQNPYSVENTLAMQHLVGWTEEVAFVTWNPPWVLALVIPFSLLDFRTSQVLWYFFQLFCIAFCANSLWKRYQGSLNRRWLSGLLTLFTASTIFLLVLGQISFLILLGIVLFLLLSDERQSVAGLRAHDRDLLAGASTLLISVKPQVFYIFWPLWLAWVLIRRRYFILAGSILALSGSLLVSLAVNPSVLTRYMGAVMDRPPDFWATPTIGYWLRVMFGMDKFWLQFLPVLFGLAWAAVYFWSRRQTFSWLTALPILAFASLITSSYTWTYDQIILLPAQIEVAARLAHKGGTPRVAAFAITWFSLQVFLFVLHLRQSDEKFIWQAPLLLIFYLVGRKL